MENRINIALDLFQGPLDLLLHLIKINEVNIYDIPIAEITKQYIEYIEMLESFDFELAGEFLIMAATLIRIKSRFLLPQQETQIEDDDWEDPRAELVERLLEYKKYKELSYHLNDRLIKMQDTYTRDYMLLQDDYREGEIQQIETDLFGLLAAYKNILSRLDNRLPEEIEGEDIKLEDKQNYILTYIKETDFLRFTELLKSARSKKEIVVTFLALLEMLRLNQVCAQQSELFDEIYIFDPLKMRYKKDNDITTIDTNNITTID